MTFRAPLTDYVISRMRRNSYGRALFSQITLIIFIVEPPKLYSEGKWGRGFQKCNRFQPLLMGHVIRRMHSGCARIFNGNQRETL